MIDITTPRGRFAGTFVKYDSQKRITTISIPPFGNLELYNLQVPYKDSWYWVETIKTHVCVVEQGPQGLEQKVHCQWVG